MLGGGGSGGFGPKLGHTFHVCAFLFDFTPANEVTTN